MPSSELRKRAEEAAAQFLSAVDKAVLEAMKFDYARKTFVDPPYDGTAQRTMQRVATNALLDFLSKECRVALTRGRDGVYGGFELLAEEAAAAREDRG